MSDIITKPLNVPPTPPEPFGDMFVTFTAQEANSTIKLYRLSTNQTLEYSTDNINWLTFNTSVTITLTNVGDKVYIRGVLSANNTASDYTKFTMSGRITASGNCNTLWNYDDLNAPLKDFCGYRMFQDCSSLTTAPDLPLTTLANHCYQFMFSNCSSLTTAPELPATTLADMCYNYMFRNCSSLISAPELPATTLVNSCYSGMFKGCSSLTTTPELPATTLADMCYSYMFKGCSSLTTTPELPATTLVNSCYSGMFSGCTSLAEAPDLPASTLAAECYISMFASCSNLSYIKCLATDISANSCTQDWVNGVASAGVFVKHPDISESTWGSGANGIPVGWSVIEDNKPVMPEDIANEIMQEVDIFAVPFNDLYETCLSVYLDMGYNVGDFDEVYAIIQSTPNLNDNVETFVISNDSNEKVITVDNNGDFYLKGVGGYDGKNTNTEDSNIKPLQDVINEKQEALVAGDNIQITDNIISATDTTYIAGDNIQINDNTISATDTTYTAGDNIQINNNVISATDTTYTAGNNIQINNNVISATDTTYAASDFDIKDLTDSTGLRSKWDNKQNALTAGNNIDITNNVITSKGYTYNNGTITTDGSVTVNGSATVTGKITATNATSHNLVYGGNELNLADLTNGNTLYFNYRNSTNVINTYKFCNGQDNIPSTIECNGVNAQGTIKVDTLISYSGNSEEKYNIKYSSTNAQPQSKDNTSFSTQTPGLIIEHFNGESGGMRISEAYGVEVYCPADNGTIFSVSDEDSIDDKIFIVGEEDGGYILVNGRGTINGSLNVTDRVNAANGFFQTSDINKKNIIGDLDLDKAYELIDKCQTILYTLKDDKNSNQQVGLIAQEVKEFFPELITEDKDGSLSLDYSRLTVVILKVLKDIINRIKILESK